MKVFYIDVYFLINLTVDIISLYSALKLTHIKSSFKRILLGGAIGACFAVVDVLIDFKLTSPILFCLLIIFVYAFIAKGALPIRRIKLIIVFLALMMLIGGVVSYLYGVLDKYFDDLSDYVDGGGENRGALLFSLIILLTIGVLRLFIITFSAEKHKESVRLRITFGDQSCECDALVDTGNLAKDPMNMNPVIFIKPSVAEKIIPSQILELSHLDSLGSDITKRVRLIPVTMSGETHVLTGFIADSISIADDGELIDATLGLDREGGTYGGYDALIPSCLL